MKKRKKTDTHLLTARRVIPKDTWYCYKSNGTMGKYFDKEHKMWLTWYGTDVCPFYRNIKESSIVGHCSLVDYEVWDMCKCCGINE